LAQFTSVAQLRESVMTRVRADKTAKMTITGGVDGQPDQAFNGIGVLRLDEGGTSMKFAEQLQRPGADPAQVRMVLQPTAILLKPPADTVLPPRKSWVQLGSRTTDPFYRRFLPMATALRGYADPQAFFAQYGDAITITHTGDDPGDGVRAVRYDLHADLAKAPSAAQANAAIEQAVHAVPNAAETGVDYKIWLDGDNRPVRTLIDEPIPGAPGPYTLDSYYTRWGEPVDIVLPAPIQVTQQ
jgi:hypothetical protein